MFNALKYTEELEKAGFSQDEAKASVRILIEVMDQNFATKTDLKELEYKMESRFQSVESRFQAIDSKFQELEYKLTIKLGTMMAVAIGITATLTQILK